MTPTPGADHGGPLVGLCTGHRCAGLWARHTPQPEGFFDPPGPAAVREAVRTSRGAVLMSLPCPGACARAPWAVVAHRAAGTTQGTVPVWVPTLDAPVRLAALLGWITADWEHGPAAVPAELGLAQSQI